MTWVVVVCLVLAALLLAWPAPGRRARWRRLFAGGRRGWGVRLMGWWHGTVTARPELAGSAPGPAARPSTGGMMAVAGSVAAVAGLLGGPVMLIVVTAYATVLVRAVVLRRRRGFLAGQRADLLDRLGLAAADLRAGRPAGAALADVVGAAGTGDAGRAAGAGPDRLAVRARAAIRLAEQTGAPLADVIERIEADARGADRAASAAAAQVAGARATAWLLAALPLAGLGLGYAIGAQPLPVLLHTPIGAAAAIGAVTLQLAGLAWVSRITQPPAVAP